MPFLSSILTTFYYTAHFFPRNHGRFHRFKCADVESTNHTTIWSEKLKTRRINANERYKSRIWDGNKGKIIALKITNSKIILLILPTVQGNNGTSSLFLVCELVIIWTIALSDGLLHWKIVNNYRFTMVIITVVNIISNFTEEEGGFVRIKWLIINTLRSFTICFKITIKWVSPCSGMTYEKCEWNAIRDIAIVSRKLHIFFLPAHFRNNHFYLFIAFLSAHCPVTSGMLSIKNEM